MKLFLGICCSVVAANAWTYTDTDAWSTDYANCDSAVANQSPINIDSGHAGTQASVNGTNPLTFQGFPDSAVNPEIRHELVINNHTWEVEWDVHNLATNTYGVQYNNNIYKLNQFHFHSPSEHTLDGQHYDLEAHMVHSCFGEECLTLPDPHQNLVVAIFMNIGEANPYLSTFWPNLATLAANSSSPEYIDDLANPYNTLVPPAPHDFYHYLGSTTTPSCVQGVEWFLMSTPATLSQEQLTSYRTAISAHTNTQTVVASAAPAGTSDSWNVALGTNNRPLQSLGDRVVQKYTSPAEIAEIDSTFMWEGILIFVLVVALALCCLAAYMTLSQPKEKKATRAVKPVKRAKPAEEIPLVAPPLLPAPVPQMFAQPLQVPMTYAAPMQMQVQPQFQVPQLQSQVRPFMVAP